MKNSEIEFNKLVQEKILYIGKIAKVIPPQKCFDILISNIKNGVYYYQESLKRIKEFKSFLNTHSFRKCRMDCRKIDEVLTKLKAEKHQANYWAAYLRDVWAEKIAVETVVAKENELQQSIMRHVSNSNPTPKTVEPNQKFTISRENAFKMMQKLIDFAGTDDNTFTFEMKKR